MNRPVEASEVAAEVRGLPPFPQLAHKVIELMRAPEPAAREVARLLATDAALTASLLRLVNSSFFGLQRRIASVQEALQVLGMNAVQRLVLSAAVTGSYALVFSGRERARTFWRAQFRCAVTARALMRDGSAECAYVAGLLHGVGELAMMVRFGDAYATEFTRNPGAKGAARVHAERSAFGIDHAQLGGAILRRWSLPEDIVEAVRRHHDATAPSGGPLVAAVWAASEIVQAVERGAAQSETLDPLGRLGAPEFSRIERELESMEGLLA
ncbi:MAG TPA: HDOD domain-containing protein [Burkholderiaceae bacterium]|nr:HDOD domain-containing protein [Burkholderiaceae bacterium]